MVPSHIYIFKERSLENKTSALLLISLSFFLFVIVIFSITLNKKFSLEKRYLYYVPSLNYISLISGTQRCLFADAFYIRGILALSEEFPEDINRLDYLLKNFEVATTLDPELIEGYFFAGIVAPVGKDEIPQGIRFLKEALKRNSSAWEIPFWLGFNYYQLGDYLKTIEYYRIASSLPDAPTYLITSLASLYYKAGKPDLGLLYLDGLYQSVKDKRLLELIKIKIEWLKNIVFLEEKVRQFKEIYGFWPKSLEELIKVGLIDKIPDDPFGAGYELDSQWYRNPGRVKSRF